MITLYVSTFGNRVDWIKHKEKVVPIEVGYTRRKADELGSGLCDDVGVK